MSTPSFLPIASVKMTIEQDLDAVVIGAGFGGVYQLKIFRDAGYSVKLLESGSDYGGVWYWNRYPGARVDSAIPHYEFSDPGLWQNWTWTERFPGSAELRKYFAFVAQKWALRKDTVFDCFVKKAVWDDEAKRWLVTTKADETYRAKVFLLNTGFAAKRYIPEWEGVKAFKGVRYCMMLWTSAEQCRNIPSSLMLATSTAGPAWQANCSHWHRFDRCPARH